MTIARNVALIVFLAMMAVFATGERSWGLLAVSVISAAVVFFTSGAHVIFTRGFWFDSEVDPRCSEIDQNIAAQEAADAERRREVRI